jgi:hypothetical protein
MRVMGFDRSYQKRCGRLLGESRPREPGLGTGRGGDVTEPRSSLFQRDVAVSGTERGSPSASQTFGSDCD